MIDIKKVALTRYAGLEVSYTDIVEGRESEVQDALEYKVKSMAVPHSDLTDILKGLEPIVADVFRIGEADGISVNGLEWCSDKAVIIHWTWYARNGANVKCATPKISLEDTYFEFEPMLAEMSGRLKEETERYIKREKRAEMTLFDECTE